MNRQSSSSTNRFTPVTRENLNEKIISQIKTLILSKGIRVGEKLPSERELTRYFGVSRAVVREAIKSLEQSGLVEIRTGATGGAFIAGNHHLPLMHVSRDLLTSGQLTLSHFYEARRTIECSAVRLAVARATDKEIENLDAINALLCCDEADPAEQGDANQAFHIAIAKMSGNPLIELIVQSIATLLNSMMNNWPETRTKKSMIVMFGRHKAITDAIRSRNADLCDHLMAMDVEHTKNLSIAERRKKNKK